MDATPEEIYNMAMTALATGHEVPPTDHELAALTVIVAAIENLPDGARPRIMHYLTARYGGKL